MSKTTKTNQTQTTNSTSTPTNPEWVTGGLEGLGGQIMSLSKADPYSFIAGADPLQTQAAAGAGALTTSPNYGQATDLFGKVAGAGANTYDPSQSTSASLLDGLDKYMSPYTKNVVDASLADFDANAGRTRAQQALDLTRSGAFGGSGSAITQSLTEGELARGRGSLDAGLRDSAFQTAANLSGQDAARRQQTSLENMGALNAGGAFNATARDTALGRTLAAGQGMVGAADSQGANDRANIGLQGSLGQILQQLAQQKAGAPISQLGTLSSLFSGLPLGLMQGQTTNGTQTTNGSQTVSDPMGSLGTAAMTAAALFGTPFTGGASLGLLGGLGGAGGALNMLTNGATGMGALKGLY